MEKAIVYYWKNKLFAGHISMLLENSGTYITYSPEKRNLCVLFGRKENPNNDIFEQNEDSVQEANSLEISSLDTRAVFRWWNTVNTKQLDIWFPLICLIIIIPIIIIVLMQS